MSSPLSDPEDEAYLEVLGSVFYTEAGSPARLVALLMQQSEGPRVVFRRFYQRDNLTYRGRLRGLTVFELEQLLPSLTDFVNRVRSQERERVRDYGAEEDLVVGAEVGDSQARACENHAVARKR